MGIAYEIHAETRMVVVALSGRITGDDVRSYLEATEADPRFGPGLNRLGLMTDVEAFPPSAEVPAIALRMAARSAPESRFAVVADTQLAIGMTNMLFGMAGMLDRLKIFPDRTTAVRWLLAP